MSKLEKKKAVLKAAAIEILKDYKKDDLSIDRMWLAAKKRAFLNDKYSESIKIIQEKV